MVRILSAPITSWLLLLGQLLRYHGVTAQTTAIDTSLQTESGFIGWYMGPSTTQALTDPETWTTSGNYARGCPKTGACAYATDCQSNSITYDDGKTSSCNQCRTMTIFETVPYGTPSASNIFCAQDWVANTVFRQLPATTTSTTSESRITSASASKSFTTTTATATTVTNSSTTAASATPTQAEPLESPVEPSKAWIAGAVVGSVAVIALAAGILVWFVRRRQPGSGKGTPTHPSVQTDLSSRRHKFSSVQEMDSAAWPGAHEMSSYK